MFHRFATAWAGTVVTTIDGRRIGRPYATERYLTETTRGHRLSKTGFGEPPHSLGPWSLSLAGQALRLPGRRESEPGGLELLLANAGARPVTDASGKDRLQAREL
jgi:hypothetical protein